MQGQEQQLTEESKQRLARWQGLPYYPISLFYKNKFGEKVWKIPVGIAQTCPNREGLSGMKTCNFCDEWGSAAYPEFREEQLSQQIEKARAVIQARYRANKFLVYFQSYTTTYQRVKHLRQAMEVARNYEDVCGYVLGTRPDCLSDALYELLNDFSQSEFLSVELGVQSFNEEQLIWMRRGHRAERSIFAIKKIKEKCPQVDLGIHLMFGLPGETDEQLLATAELVNSLPIDNVKLHNLHVLKNTPLAEDYLAGKFAPISREEYSRRVILFLRHLKPSIAVHRLTAVANRHDELVAPQWAGSKMESYQYLLDQFNANQFYQGQLL